MYVFSCKFNFFHVGLVQSNTFAIENRLDHNTSFSRVFRFRIQNFQLFYTSNDRYCVFNACLLSVSLMLNTRARIDDLKFCTYNILLRVLYININIMLKFPNSRVKKLLFSITWFLFLIKCSGFKRSPRGATSWSNWSHAEKWRKHYLPDSSIPQAQHLLLLIFYYCSEYIRSLSPKMLILSAVCSHT